METAICGRISLSPNHLFNPSKPGDKFSLCKGPSLSPGTLTVVSATAPGKGGVLDRPTIPGRVRENDVKKSRKTAPPYRVILHNDNHNKREYVVQVLVKVIPGMCIGAAIDIMQEAHVHGLSVVIVCAQEDAEEHCMQLRGNGLLSSIEPEGGGC